MSIIWSCTQTAQLKIESWKRSIPSNTLFRRTPLVAKRKKKRLPPDFADYLARTVELPDTGQRPGIDRSG